MNADYYNLAEPVKSIIGENNLGLKIEFNQNIYNEGFLLGSKDFVKDYLCNVKYDILLDVLNSKFQPCEYDVLSEGLKELGIKDYEIDAILNSLKIKSQEETNNV